MKVLVRGTEPVRVATAVDGVHLTTASAARDLAVAPDFISARRLTSMARRRDLVEIVLDGSDHGYGVLTATWHRVPLRRTIPLGAALALALSGVPASLQDERAR
jgi:hypothetical protein